MALAPDTAVNKHHYIHALTAKKRQHG